MQAARATLYHSKLPASFWEDAVRDATFKYNLALHSATKQQPYTRWFGTQPKPKKLFPFGQRGTVPLLMDPTARKKLTPRSFQARYMFALDLHHIMVLNLETGKYIKARACDFHPYSPHQDPVHTNAIAFKCKLPLPDPPRITATTHPPSSLKQARRYPDASELQKAHDAELDKLDSDQAIQWLSNHDLPKNVKLVPLLMTYRYKRTPTGVLLERKARCALRGDLMIPGLHYNPDHTTAFMADKSTVRITFAIAAALQLQIDHFDIKSAFIQEPYKFAKPVYVKQHPRFDGSFKHAGKGGLLIKNIYGGPSGSFYYLKGAEEFLSSIGFCQCQSDPCLFFLLDDRGFIIITLNMDDFLVTSNKSALIDWLQRKLESKYPSKVKRLGPPTQYLGWKVDYLPSGVIKISQPQYIHKALTNARMTDANGRPCPHVDGTQYHPPNELDKSIPLLKEKFQAILGELRYLADCTRPDIVYYVNRLASATQNPTRRHWLILKNLLRYLKQTASHGIMYHPVQQFPTANQPSNTAILPPYKQSAPPLPLSSPLSPTQTLPETQSTANPSVVRCIYSTTLPFHGPLTNKPLPPYQHVNPSILQPLQLCKRPVGYDECSPKSTGRPCTQHHFSLTTKQP